MSTVCDRYAGLRAVIEQIIRCGDGNYELRNPLVIKAVQIAIASGLKAGFRFDPDEPEWPVAMIELPHEGQVSWHLPQHVREWDGHDTATKWLRCAQFMSNAPRAKMLEFSHGFQNTKPRDIERVGF